MGGGLSWGCGGGALSRGIFVSKNALNHFLVNSRRTLPIGLSTKMQNKKNTTFLALLRLFFALELTKTGYATVHTRVKVLGGMQM